MEPVWKEWDDEARRLQGQSGRSEIPPKQQAPKEKLLSKEDLKEFQQEAPEGEGSPPESEPKPRPQSSRPKFRWRKDPQTGRRRILRESQWQAQEQASQQQAAVQEMVQENQQMQGQSYQENLAHFQKKQQGAEQTASFEANQEKFRNVPYQEARKQVAAEEQGKQASESAAREYAENQRLTYPQRLAKEQAKTQPPEQPPGEIGKPAGERPAAEQQRERPLVEQIQETLPTLRTPEKGATSMASGRPAPRAEQQQTSQAGASVGPAITQLAATMREQSAKMEKMVENTTKMLEALNGIKDKISQGWT